jgi:glycosyltransferase involved in cell wall biosynthesis
VAEALVREQRRAGHEAWILFLYGAPGELTADFAPNAVCLGLQSSRQAWLGLPSLVGKIRQIKPDIIHSHDGILWPRLALSFIRIPVVTHAHLSASPQGTMKQWFGWKLVKKTTSHLIGISQHTMDTWVQAGFPEAKVTYIPNGVDFNRFAMSSKDDKTDLRHRLGLPPDKTLLLWVGRVQQSMKGTDRVERLARLLPNNMVLVMVGGGPDYAGMRERCGELLGSGSLIMTGAVQHPEEYYKAADLYLFTSYYEPFGLVLLEAVAAGLPIMAFPVTGGGGAVELLQEIHAVDIQDDSSPDEVTKALNQVLDRTELPAENRKHARQNYSWEEISRQVVGVYTGLVGL